MKTKLNVILAASAMVFGCVGMAGASPFVPDANTDLLLHMDVRSAGGPYTTPDVAGGGYDALMYGKDGGGNDHYDTAITDAKFVASQAGYGNAIHFDGVNDVLMVTADQYLAFPFDHAAVQVDWSAKFDASMIGDDGSEHYMFNQANTFGALFIDHATAGRDQIGFRFWCGPGSALKTVYYDTAAPGADFDLTEWHDYSMKFDGGIMSASIDGIEIGSLDTGYAEVAPAIRRLSIGANWDGGSKLWGGDLDEFRVQTIPEPSTLALMGVMGGAVLFIRKKYRI